MRNRIAVVLVGFVLVIPTHAQFDSGQISGFVRDPSKSVIVGASVTAINGGNGEKHHATTNSSGYYVFPTLFVASYIIEVGAPGFKKSVQTGIKAALPRLGGIGYFTENGSSEYNALQISFNRRLSKGISFTSGYSEARAHDNVTGLGTGTGAYGNLVGPLPQAIANVQSYHWANSDFNIRRRFTFGGNYDLPFGKSLKGVAEKLVAGWQLNGSMAWQTGLPFTVADQSAVSGILGLGGNAERPNLLRNNIRVANPTVGILGQFLDPNAFAIPAAGTLGSAPRNLGFGPNQNVIDLSLFKNVLFKERYNVQFRAEAFNLPNLPVFDRPAFNNFGNPAFGKITGLAPGYSMRQIQLALKLLF